MKQESRNLLGPETIDLPNTGLIKLSMALSKPISIVIALIGFAVLVGWAFDITLLKSIHPLAESMKANTALQTEVFRKAITTKTYNATQFICKLSLGADESVFTIREIGLFADGTDTLGSGTLFSQCNVNIAKNASTQYLITYTITAQ